MISRYRLMRGVLKRKFAREFCWRLTALCLHSEKKKFIARTQATIKNSIFGLDQARVGTDVDLLSHNGATPGLPLPEPMVKEVLAYATQSPVYADRDKKRGFYLSDLKRVEQKLGKEVLLAQYFNILNNEHIRKIAYDPYLLLVAASYLQAPPKLMGANLWWTFPSNPSAEDKSKHAHVFHYDLDDVKFVKFFFYITDVDEDCGPHVYVEGSNRVIKYKNSWLRSLRFTDAEIEEAYGRDKVKYVMGPAGSTLIEDTITIHKGTTPTKQPRLLLQFEFSINTYPEMSCECDESELAFAV
ncbi:phytanoyl-CoA dioxygenase family protein [Vogesella sp. AC12]|uniref:phytanoyl-CoA dioxygenase family protein n=1 Tax=Vogesella sp. AC12 TaxID=2950550 RepID=UPI002108E3AE|nr:phytanoyl-CoA dioxygenase family protein [Vogesella sp. AC12]MCQ4143610.1 hypothetical protein [Vogesella sp. AC12]